MEEKDIRWAEDAVGTRLDMEYYDELQNVVGFVKFYCVVVGLVGTVGVISHWGTPYWVFFLVNLLCVVGWGVYVAWAMTHRKPNAVFHARSMLIVSLANNVCNLATDFSLLGLALVVVNAFCLYRVFRSRDLSEVFPLQFRRHSILDWAVVVWLFFLPIIVYVVCALVAIFV